MGKGGKGRIARKMEVGGCVFEFKGLEKGKYADAREDRAKGTGQDPWRKASLGKDGRENVVPRRRGKNESRR